MTANPFSADAWAIRALALEQNKRYPEAVASALQALAINPKNATALAFMAEAYLDAGQPATAEEKANQALQADPNSAEAHYMHGLWNADSNFSDTDALDDFQTAHDLAPNLPQVAGSDGVGELASAKPRRGVRRTEQVIENNPNDLDALFALGYLQYQANGDAEQSGRLSEPLPSGGREKLFLPELSGDGQEPER